MRTYTVCNIEDHDGLDRTALTRDEAVSLFIERAGLRDDAKTRAQIVRQVVEGECVYGALGVMSDEDYADGVGRGRGQQVGVH